jgi:hypothetical protein
MPTTTRQRENIQNQRQAVARQKRLNELKRKGPMMPSVVLKALQQMGLPNDPEAYNAKLKELLRS